MRTSLSGANAHRLAEIRDKYLSVTDFSRARRVNNGLHDSIHLLIIYCQLELYFGQKIDDVFRPSIKFSVALLPAKTFALCHGNALNPYLRQRSTHIVQFEGFDDGDHHFHATGSKSDEHAVYQRNSKEIAAPQHGELSSSDV